MKPLMLNDIDPLPVRLGAKVEPKRALELEYAGTVPATRYATSDGRAWMDSERATSRDLVARPHLFYRCCTRDDPLGQLVRRIVPGQVAPSTEYCLTDAHARQIMCDYLLDGGAYSEGALGRLALAELHAAYWYMRHNKHVLGERQIIPEAMRTAREKLVGFGLNPYGMAVAVDERPVPVGQSLSAYAEMMRQKAAQERVDAWQTARNRGDVLTLEGFAVQVGPGTPQCVTIKGDEQERVWRVVEVSASGQQVMLERDGANPSRLVAWVRDLAHDIPF